jgi:hypothetical protein
MTPPITLGILASAGKGKVYYIATGYAYGLNEQSDMAGAAFDSADNAYFYGARTDTNGSMQASLLIKITPAGTIAFKKNLGNYDNYRGHGYKGRVRIDSSGNICILTSNGDSSFNSLARLPADGSSFNFQRRVRGGNLYANTMPFAIDASGNFVNAVFNFNGDYAMGIQVIRPSDSTALINTRYNYNASSTVGVFGAGVDSAGNYYIAGSNIYSTGNDYVGIDILKFNAAGTLQYSRRTYFGIAYDGTGSFAIDKIQNYMYGSYRGVNGGTVYCIFTSYDTAGNHRWTKFLDKNIMIRDAATDSYGNVYFVGQSYEVAGAPAVIFKFNSSGTLLWQRTIQPVVSGTNNGFQLSGIAISSNNDFIISGTSGNNNNQGNYTMMKLPGNGSLTGSYTIGTQVFNYAVSSIAFVTQTPSLGTTAQSSSSIATTNLGYYWSPTDNPISITTKIL